MFWRILLLIIIAAILNWGKKTYVAEEAYDDWENEIIRKDVEILIGQYWKSAHWTYEYVVFLELRSSEKWMDKFFEIHQTEVDKSGTFNSENETHPTNGSN